MHLSALLVMFTAASLGIIDAGKTKKTKDTKKKPGPVNDPLGLRELDDWTALGKEVLALSCELVNIQSTGSTATLAARLHSYWQFYAAQNDLPPPSATNQLSAFSFTNPRSVRFSSGATITSISTATAPSATGGALPDVAPA